MKIHLGWIRVTAAAVLLAGAGAQPGAAQYSTYRGMPQPVGPAAEAASPVGVTATPRVGSQQPYWQQSAQQAQTSQAYQAPVAPVATAAQYPQTSAAYVPTATAMPAYAPSAAYAPTPAAAQAAPLYAPAQPYAASAYAPTAPYQPYPRLAYQQSEALSASAGPEADGTLPAPAQPEGPKNGAPEANGTNGQAHNGHVQNGHMQNGYSHHGYPQNGQSVPSYAAGGNCSNNGYPGGQYYSGDQACGDNYGLTEYFDDGGYESQWFGGVYYLFMERDRSSPRKVTVAAADAATYPYFPAATTTVLVAPDHDFRSGAEIRFGSTFTIGDECDTCDTGCNTGCGDCNTGCSNGAACCSPTVYAWEFAVWGLGDDENDNTYLNQPTTGLFGMVNFAGLGYDRDGDAAIDNPANAYYGYALPIPATSNEILAQRVRTNFKAQNLELNIIRFPVCNVSCGGCSNSCDTGCNSGCDTACEPACAPASFSMYGMCGVRYFRADDEFMYATEFDGGTQTVYDGWSYADDNELFYDVDVDNNLLGPQLGWTMNHNYCKWNFFCNSAFGVFGNHIEQNQRMWSGGGGAVYFYDPATGGTGERFDVSSDKDDIAFLGELRMGGSYDFSCHWRGVLAYRAVAMTGVATATEQIPSDFTNPEWVAIIDSDSSMVVHGVQIGAECRY